MSDFSFDDFLPDRIKQDLEQSKQQEESQNERKEKLRTMMSQETMIDTSFFLSNAILSLLIEKKILESKEIDRVIEELLQSIDEQDKQK